MPNATSGQHWENCDVKREIVHYYPRNVDCCCTWPDAVAGISARFSKFAFVLFCYMTNHLMTGPLGNSEFWFPSNLSRETLRFSGNKIHCSPRDQRMPVQNSLTPEMTCVDGLIQTSVSSHETIVEQYEESHFLVKEKSELVDEERNDKKGANISGVEKTAMCKASEREYIQQTEKLKNRKTSKPEFMQKKRVQAVNEVKDNHKKIK